MIVASGVLFLTPDKKALFVQRSSEGDCSGCWALPGGKLEEGESHEIAVERECIEEIGIFPEGKLINHTRRINNEVDYTTFLMNVEKEFKCKLNEEHTAYVWAPIDVPPLPIHPGCAVSIAKLNMDELGIARAIVSGELTSPQWYENIALFDIRITGTGIAYRKALDEFAFRNPDIYLNQDFLDRCNGLPVILEHPPTKTLNTEEFTKRVVGTVLLPYIKGSEVWAIAKIYDKPTAEQMESYQLSTSPAVVFRDLDVNSKMELENGSTLLLEGKPSLLDHIALCEQGVWDKGGDPTGVRTDSIGDTKMEKDNSAKDDSAKVAADAEEERKRSDAEAGQKLDKILAALDSINSRVDALEKEPEEKERKDAFEKEEKEKADAEEKEKSDAEEKERKDAEDKKEKERMDARSDTAEVRRMIADLQKQLPKELTDTDFKVMADAQARADSVYNYFGKSAPRFLNGETPAAYKRRLVGELQPYSKSWKSVDLNKLHDDAFSIAEEHIYNDSIEAGLHPTDIAEDTLREIITSDPMTGRRTITFAGQPKTWMRNFSHEKQVARIQPARNR